MPFCRITGGSRALPKPNYFPLLPPISPADARRFCRITGKAIGLPGHHYIPVLVGARHDKEHCHITHKSEGNEHHQFLGLQHRRHAVRDDYRYVFPVLEEGGELQGLLASKPAADGEAAAARAYVYTVHERRTSLVLPSRLEAAVRDGDVRDVMLARDADHLLLTMRKGKSVSLDVRDYAPATDGEDLWDGEGPGEVAYQRDQEDRQRRQKREAGLADRKRIFEDKENLAAQEERRRHSAKVMKVKMQAEREERKRKKAKSSEPRRWDRFEPEDLRTDARLYLSTGELQDLAKPLVGAFDAPAFDKEAPVVGEATVTTLPVPVDVAPVVVDLETSSPGIVQQPALLEEVGGFPTVQAVAPFTPLTAEPDAAVQAAVQLVDPGALPRQAEVKAVFMEEAADGKLLNALPRIEEVPELVNNLDKGEAVCVGGKVHALRLDIAAAQGAQQRLVVGQAVDTPSGRVFVPGHTVQTASGPVFMPGLTVHTPDGPLLIPGHTVDVDGQKVFVAGQALHTRDGQKFVQGQMLYGADGEGRFAPGQTVLTPEGPRFVPGQVVADGREFVVGQTVSTPAGPRFVPGQTLTTASGEALFLPGQAVLLDRDGDKEWEFVPGQSARHQDGELVFIPGQTVATPDGPKFVAGQTVTDDAGNATQFVPGAAVRDAAGLRFVPGATLATPDGPKFIEGQVVKTAKGEVKFSPGSFVVAADGVTVLSFTAAASLGDVVFRNALPDPGAANALEQREEVLGHMVQTSQGVEFFPGKANGLPSGKVIQGKLIKSASGAVQFVPGMEIDGVFVAGQLVMTELGEQFVPGQVVDTKEGPKFVPGQVVETHAGPKFLPGQTVVTADGPRFVPGQIIETKAGPTFIPGQVICTEEEGSRFVPGQIVDTREGPRFVPGRVIETGDRVTFVPGQIVETADGLRFVAPDLQDTEEGGFEFSLQGFEVTPEELRLMRPHLSATATAPTTAGQMTIDSRMLRQLSHAGMVVGKQVELPGVDVATMGSLPTLALAAQLGLEGVAAVKMGHVLEAVLKLSYGLLDERGHIRRKMSVTIERGLLSADLDAALSQEEEALKNMLTEAIVTACITMDERAEEEDVLRAVCNFFNSILESVRDKDGVVEALHGFVTYPGHVGLLCRETVCQLGQGLGRADLLRSLLWGGEAVLERLEKLLQQDQLGQAFLHLAEAEPELLGVVLRRVTQAVRDVVEEDVLDSDQDAADLLQRCIVAVVREASELRLQEMLDSDELALRELMVQAINLARALGMQDVARGLLAVLSDPSATRALAGDRITLDILQRLTVMRQLAERRPKFNSALGKLVSDPETARNDPRLRELVRQSAALMVVPEDQCLPQLQSSADIPTALFQNTLAMEEYLRRRGAGNKGALLIVKHGFQTVIPREAARHVLTGQIPYTLVDQKGIRHFAPMHVFSALRLSQPLANRYSMYHNVDGRRGSATSASTNAEANTKSTSAPESTVQSTCLRCVHGDHRHHSTFTEVADVLTAREDVVGERLSLRKGDLVEVLDTTGDAKRPRLDLDLHGDPDLDLGLGADAASLLDNSSARHKMSIRPKRRHADPRARSPNPQDRQARWLVRLVSDPSQTGWIPASSLERRPSTCWPSPPSADHADEGRGQDAVFRREAVVRELVETEEEFGRDMRHVVERYMRPVDSASVPRVVRDNKTLVFGNLKEIAEFHNTVLIEGIKYYADEPRMIGKTFLRLERDFDKHVAYCRDEPQAQEFLQDTPQARDFYEELSQRLGDDKNLPEHLKLPIQRINDYQLLLKELVRYCSRLGEDTTDLSKALELMLGVPHRANDIKFISNIEGYHGNIHKLGRLLRHDWFTVTYRDGRAKERYLFLFKARILVCKVRRISEDRSVFVLKDIIRLPELEVKDLPDNSFQLRHQDGDVRPYPLLVSAHNDTAKDVWLKEIKQYAADSLALAEHAADDLHVKDDEASSAAEPSLKQPKQPNNKVVIHKIQVEEPTTPEPFVEEPATPALDANGLSKEKGLSVAAQDDAKARVEDVTEEVFHDAVEDVTEAVKEEKAVVEKEEAVQNGADMSEYSSRRTSIRRAGSSRTEVEAGETATFECSVAGEESTTVTWLKDNKPLSDRLADRVSKSNVDNSFKLEIQNLLESDTGMYTAHATNSEGASTCTAHLLVQKLTEEERQKRAEANHPVFLVQLKDTELLQDTYLRFMVKVKGNPNPTVRFYKDDSRILSTNDRLKVNNEQSDAGYYELVIPEVKPEDAGKYSCVAINSYGEERCDAQLTVVDDKDVFAGLEETDEELKPGERPAFHWTRNGQAFDPEERFKVLLTDEEDSLALVFQHVKPEDAGLYTCVAQTSSGKISCSAELTVKGGVNALQREPEKPKITVETKTQEVSIGGSAMLELKVEGSPKPEVAWTKDGQDVKAGGRVRFLYEDDESMSMIIKNVTPEDAGTYTVTAWNDMGEDFAEVTLNVKSPPKFKTKIQDQACMMDDTLRVRVEVEGRPPPELSWFKDGKEIVEDSRFHIVKESDEVFVLVIEKMVLEDSGSFSVVARNEVSQSSEFFKVAVQSPPFFTQKIAPRKIEVREGDFVTFSVKVDGDPKPRVRWLKDDTELLNDDRHVKIESDRDGETHTLTLRGITRDDMGKYTCELDNRNGRCSDSTTMHVHCVPLVKQKLRDIVSKEGDLMVVFDVTIEAFPEPEIKWSHNDVEVTERKTLITRTVDETQLYLKTYKLTMKEVHVDQAGQYTCTATNPLGTTDNSSNFKVLYVPKITKKLENVSLDEGETLELNIEANAVPIPDVTWYKDGKKLSAEANANIKISRDRQRQESYSLTLNLCKYQDSGEYEARVSNDQGTTSTKCNVTVNAKPVVTKHNMQDSQIYESLAKVYEVHCIGEPKPVATWSKDGEEVTADNGHLKVSESGDLYKLEVPPTFIPTDEGVYKLHLENRLGAQDLECNLKLIPVEELRKPKLKLGLKDTTAKKGEKAVLKAVITGDPVPDIKWWKDGVALLPDKDPNVIINCDTKFIQDDLKECTYSVTIPSARHGDTGQYSLKASNKFGEVESSAILNIILRPEIEGMKDKTGIPTTITQWDVVIHANPAPDVKWLKDDKPIVADDHFEVLEDRENETYSLRVNDTATDDHGVYTVTARNSQGDASKSAQLSLHTEKPSFVKDLVDRIIKDDSPVEFKVRVNGDPKPKITWLKDGREVVTDDRVTVDTSIEGQVTSVLAISHVRREDVALYTCVASNMVGEARTEAQLNMDQAPPMVTIPLEKCIEVDEGEPLEIKGKIDGSPVPIAKWFKDSVEIDPDDPHVKLTLLPDGTVKLNIDEVKHNDGGAYKVMAVNKNGQMASLCAVAVKPKNRAPEFTQPLQGATVPAGQPLKLEALVTAFPVPEVKWFKDGHAIRPSKEVNFINDPVGHVGLVIDAARPEDAGEYTVKVTNKLGGIEGKAVAEVLERERRPAFHAQLLPQKVVEGFPVRLQVKVVGHPPPELTWTCNGKEIKPDGKNVKLVSQPDGSHALVIEKVGPEHAGEYTVTATNDQGSVSSSAPLEVQGKDRAGEPDAEPSFVRPPRDTTADEGGPLSLSATFLGNPIPDVTWLKDGQPLEPSERVKITCDGKKVGLDINPCNLDDVGTYTCRLTNPHGSAEAAAQANVRKVFTPAFFVQKFSDMQQMPGLDVKFMARIGGNPKPTVGWFFNGKPIAESDKFHMKRDDDHICLYVKDCTKKDNGTYTCKIGNTAGKAMCNADLEVVDKIEKKQKMEPPSFLKKIGDCEVVTGMSAKFTACVNGVPDPEYEWFRNGQRLEPGDRFIMEAEGSGLLRLIVKDVDQGDVGTYRLRIFNPHGEASCEAELRYDSLETKQKPLSDQYQDFKKVKTSGVPMPLPNAPIISRMTDRRLTLSWRPSIPTGPRAPVTYQVEMCELPDGEWFTARKGIRSCVCDLHNLEPFRNYKFRIRVENKYGISDPSPYAITHREKLEPPPPKFFPYLEPGIDFRPETSPYFPKDFDIERPPHDGYAQAPRFLRQEHDTQYGVKNHNCNLMWFVYGYPKPVMKYYFNDELIESGGRFDQSYTRNGQATLFINKMLERDVGVYEAVATNEHGEARQRVRLEIAEFPVFLKRPEETTIMHRKGTRVEARVIGVPYPDIKWFKDWMPIVSSERIKIVFVEPDTCHLHISDAINRDEGLYSITASNVAGSVSHSIMIHVEEDERRYWDQTYLRPKPVRPHKEMPLAEAYDLGDELGRGTQGITYHAVERSTGRNYAAKVMHGKGELRKFMDNELEMMSVLHHRRLIRLHDAYERNDGLTLVTDMAAGGELLDVLTSRPFYTEYDIAGYIRQLLEGLEHMHFLNVAHLGLTPGDLLLAHPGGDDLKICDFGLARRISAGGLHPLLYGMPEFVAPEVMRGDGVALSADMWSVGIITYLLLSGRSLFRGENDRETLTKIKEGKWAFDEDLFSNYSAEARDFISKLLVYVPGGRLNVEQALDHPWFNILHREPYDPYRMSSDALKNYYNLYKDWYSNASCRNWYRRRPLEGAFTHPSKMVYPPYERYTPEPTPEREPYKSRNWEEEIHTGGTDLNYEIGLIKSESHYQNGPDTYLLQLRDVDFPVRLREYLKVAANRGPGYSRIVADQSHLDWRAPVIRERRRFTDVMDEEIDDERKARINKYGSDSVYSLRRLRHELGTRLDGHAEAEAIMQTRHEEQDGHLPFFREKPLTIAIVANEDVEISCLVVGDPKPLVQWYKCDMVLQETVRISFKEDDEGRSILRLGPAHNMDIGIYKVVARNKGGQTVARFRVVLAGVPDSPDSPDVADVSDDEVFLRWKQPRDDGNTAVLCYALQYKEVDGDHWLDIAKNIDHEFYVVKNLQQMSRYYFRLAAKNRVGWSDYGIPIKVKTKPTGVPKVEITRAMAHLQSITESGAEVNELEAAPKLDYSVENRPINWIPEHEVSDKYHFISEISRGRFSVVVKGVEKGNDHIVAGKLLELRPEREVAVNREFEALRRLRHERIAQLLEAYRAPGSEVAVLILEKLQGADVLTYFSSRHEYNEQMVCNVVSQVLDGLQYLQWRGLCHLDLQPDNIVMASVRSLQVKLVDLGSAQTVSKLGSLVDRVGHIEFSSPEMLNDEPVFPQSDMWSLGVVTYVLLSGVSPFRGENNEETRQNVLFVRYRFEHLFKELTQEATRFLMLIFKRTPTKRPTIEECHEHRWLLPTEFMIKKRERASFLGMRLKDFCDEYHTLRERQAINADSLVGSISSSAGDSSRRLTLSRSDSIVEELSNAFQNGAVE